MQIAFGVYGKKEKIEVQDLQVVIVLNEFGPGLIDKVWFEQWAEKSRRVLGKKYLLMDVDATSSNTQLRLISGDEEYVMNLGTFERPDWDISATMNGESVDIFWLVNQINDKNLYQEYSYVSKILEDVCTQESLMDSTAIDKALKKLLSAEPDLFMLRSSDSNHLPIGSVQERERLYEIMRPGLRKEEQVCLSVFLTKCLRMEQEHQERMIKTMRARLK